MKCGGSSLKAKMRKPSLSQIERIVEDVVRELCLSDEDAVALQVAVQDAFDVWVESVPYRKRAKSGGEEK
jgi:hypothetical protein